MNDIFIYMKTKILIIICLFLISVTISAQQAPISTIFVENPFVFNPAIAGTDNGFRMRLNSRMQWMGFGDGPITNTLSVHGPHQVRPMGYGGNLSVDNTGPISTIKASGTYAHNIFITSDVRASFGLNLGFIQFRADGTLFELPDPNVIDASVQHSVMSNFKPDAGAGVYVYHFDWFFGLSAQQLFGSNLTLSDNPEKATNQANNLKTHFYGYGGYRFYFINKMVIEPSVLVRKIAVLPMQMDVIARVIYDKQFWGGISTRYTFDPNKPFDDICLIFGYIHERRLYFSVAWDFTFAKIRSYTAGTMELVVGYNFDDLKRGR